MTSLQSRALQLSAAFLATLALSCGRNAAGPAAPGTPASPLLRVKVMLSWSPVSEHAFLYYGIKKGFFRNKGFEVTVLPSRGSTEVARAFEAKTIDFGFISGDVLVSSRIDGVRIRALATTIHESPTSLYSLASAGIVSPTDLRGKRVGVLEKSAVYPQYRLFLKRQGIDPASITEVPTAGSPQELTKGRIDAAIHYTHLVPTYLRAEGEKINEILLKDYGVEVVSSSLATTDAMLEDHPKTVAAFVSAFLHSLDASYNNPDAALEALLEAEPPLKRDPTRASLLRANELIFTDLAKKRGPGYLSADDWAQTQKSLFDAEQITQKISTDYFYDERFVDAYREQAPFVP